MPPFHQIVRSACDQKRASLGRQLTRGECDEVLDECFAEALKGAKREKKTELTDEQWVAEMEREPALKGINIRREIGLAQLWCKQNRRVPTRRFLTNWFNRAEKVVDLKAMGAQHATGLKPPPPPGPEGWHAWLKTELDMLSPEADGHSQLTAALYNRNFNLMPNSWKEKCWQSLTHKSA